MFDKTDEELVEAKGYDRHVDHKTRAVLLPSDPGADLLDLLHSVTITCIYEDEPGVFVRREP